MRLDYHMHFEYGSYDEEWVKGFFKSAKINSIDEIGISEHSHGFVEFKELYYKDLILDGSFIGENQAIWLKTNKFKNSIQDYSDFINMLKNKGYPVKQGIEVCNFQNQTAVTEILNKHNFDYIIGSIHFIEGWAYDTSSIKKEWENRNVLDVYKKYVEEIEKICYTKTYDILGHPFNIRLFKYIPKEDIKGLLERAVIALKENDMVIDINTGTLYRYPIEEISPYPEFMKMAAKYKVPIITSSDAHHPEDCGKHIDLAVEYAKSFGYKEVVVFNQRKRETRELT